MGADVNEKWTPGWGPMVEQKFKINDEFLERAALAALTGLLSNEALHTLQHGETAKLAWDFAEAMLVERSGREIRT